MLAVRHNRNLLKDVLRVLDLRVFFNPMGEILAFPVKNRVSEKAANIFLRNLASPSECLLSGFCLNKNGLTGFLGVFILCGASQLLGGLVAKNIQILVGPGFHFLISEAISVGRWLSVNLSTQS